MSDAITVSLTPDELYQAAIVGTHRRITSMFRRSVAQHYDDPTGGEWSSEIESCCAELAVAKWMGAYWTGGVFNGKRAEEDVPGRQVRHTVYPNGSLIIYPEDKPDDKFLLVTGKAPTYTLAGWAFGRDAMEGGTSSVWWLYPAGKRAPSWWIPQSALRKMR